MMGNVISSVLLCDVVVSSTKLATAPDNYQRNASENIVIWKQNWEKIIHNVLPYGYNACIFENKLWIPNGKQIEVHFLNGREALAFKLLHAVWINWTEYRTVTRNLETMLANCKVKKKDMLCTINSFCYRMCLFQKKFWLPCRNSFIYVYSLKGELQDSIDLSPAGIWAPHSICPGGKHALLLASTSGIHILDERGQILTHLQYSMTAYFDDLYVQGELLVALRQENPHIYTWDLKRLNQLSKPRSKLPVKLGPLPSNTLMAQDSHVYISDNFYSKVYQYNMKGKLVGELGEKGPPVDKFEQYTAKGVEDSKKNCGPGQFQYIKLCCRDSSGSMLLADSYCDVLQIRTSTGKWIKLGLETSSPHDVVIIHDTVFILHGNLEKSYITRYKIASADCV